MTLCVAQVEYLTYVSLELSGVDDRTKVNDLVLELIQKTQPAQIIQNSALFVRLVAAAPVQSPSHLFAKLLKFKLKWQSLDELSSLF